MILNIMRWISGLTAGAFYYLFTWRGGLGGLFMAALVLVYVMGAAMEWGRH